MLKSYPKILPLVGKYAELVTGKVVEVTEKVDGSQFRFGRDAAGDMFYASKNARLMPEMVDKLFGPAVRHIESVADRIPPGMAFYGETLCSPRHNTLAYGKVPWNHIALFGVTDFDMTQGYGFDTVAQWAERLDVDTVPLLGMVTLDNPAEALRFMDRESYLGVAKIEGVVLKNYDAGHLWNNMAFPFVALKLVSEAFKEKHASNPEWEGQTSKLEKLLATYRTEARWAKAVQHMRDSGQLIGEPKDIGVLMGEIAKDLIEEEYTNFQEELGKLFKKQWVGNVQRGFPEYYKRLLLDQPEAPNV